MSKVNEFAKTNVLEDILNLAVSELNQNGNIGYTMPDGKHHIYIYLDDSIKYADGSKTREDGFYVVEPNRVVDGAYEPMGDTASADYNDFGNLMVACMWCMDQFEADNQLSNDRLTTLLYNAISLLEESGCDKAQLEYDLGITSEEYAAVMEEDKKNEYPILSMCTDYAYLKENLNETALEALEGILDAYTHDKIDINLVRNEKGELDFDASFDLIINDKDYKKTGCEVLALKWYEDFEDTGYLVECFKDAYETNRYHFTVDYNENGQKKSFEMNIFSNEKPDSKHVAQSIADHLSTHYKGSLEKALASIDSVDVLIEDYNGEYVDSDEIYGEDLKALFSHLQKDKPGLESLISNAQQKAEEKKNWIEEKREELSGKPRSEWTEEDWEAHNYCENTTAEADYFDSLDDR